MANVSSKFDLIRLMPADGFRLFPLQKDLFDFIDSNNVGGTYWVPMCVEIPPVATKRDREEDTPRAPQTRFFAAFTHDGVLRYLSIIPLAQQHLYELVREGTSCRLYFDLEREVDFTIHNTSHKDTSEEYDAAFGEQLRAAPAICPNHCTSMPNNNPDHVLGELFYYLVLFLKGECAELGMHTDLIRRASRRLLHRYHLEMSDESDADALRSEEVIREAAAILREQSTCLQSVPIFKLEEGAGERWAHPFEPTQGKFSLHVVVRTFHGDSELLFPTNVHVGSVVSRFVTYLYTQLAALRAAELRGEYEGYERLAALHSSLMFHSVAPPGFPVVQYVRGGQVCTGTLTPLMCMIDTSVYSRNRVFRCLGSSKLGKSNVLVGMGKTASPYLEWWFDTLVCPWNVDTRGNDNGGSMDDEGGVSLWDSYVHLEESNSNEVSYAVPPSYSTILEGLPTPSKIGRQPQSVTHNKPLSQGMGPPVDQHLSPLLEAVLLSCVSHRPYGHTANATAVASLGSMTTLGNTVAFAVRGTRFCHKVGREHRSNGVYVCLQQDDSGYVCFQRCHDPDCNRGYDGSIRRYRSPPVRIPDGLVAEVRLIVPETADSGSPPV